MSVLLAFCSPGEVPTLFMDSVLRLFLHDLNGRRLLCDKVSIISGPRISHARNQLVREFFAHPSKPEWLWMIDADMTFPPDTLERLVDRADPKEHPIVGGLCFGGGRTGATATVFPTLYQIVDPAENENVVKVIEDYEPGTLVPVDATGCACLLIHRTVLEKILERWEKYADAKGTYENPCPWFAESIYRGIEFGEDWTFCVRARQEGFPIVVDTAIRVGHVKSRVVDESVFRDYLVLREQYGTEGANMQARRAAGLTATSGEDLTARAPTVVVIPVKDRIDLTKRILRDLYKQGGYDQIIVLDNGSKPDNFEWLQIQANEAKIILGSCPDLSVNEMWAAGIDGALNLFPDAVNVAILNNDLHIGPDFCNNLAIALRQDPTLWAVCPNYDGRKIQGTQYVNSTFKNRGLAGFAFMVKGEAFRAGRLAIDTQFEHWFGDDDLVCQIEKEGYRVGITGLTTVEHIGGGSQTARNIPRDTFTAMAERDQDRMLNKWGRY